MRPRSYFARALQAEQSHFTLYTNAKTAVDSGKDMPAGNIYGCPVCGEVFFGVAPDVCPVCGTPKAQFKMF